MRSKIIYAYQNWKQSRVNAATAPKKGKRAKAPQLRPIEEGLGEFIIYCDGGLCNRLNGLVVGYYAARVLNRIPTILWPLTHVCDCPFDRLLVANESINIQSEVDTDEVKNSFAIWDADYREPHHINPTTIKDWEGFQRMLPPEKVVYGNASLVPWVDMAAAFELFKQKFDFHPLIKAEVERFIKEQNVRDAVGLHFRTTDFILTFESYEIPLQKALRTKRRVFVCSDSEEAENRAIAANGQLFRRDKSAYVEKRDETLPWHLGDSFNVYRGEMAVIDAAIDLCVLSATSEQYGNIGSSFFNFARHLSY